MYGDTTVIRHLALGLREQAAEIRQQADSVVAAAEATPWRGRAAEAMRASARRHASELRATAELHDDAAIALLRHARRVEETKALIAALEASVRDLVDAARGRLGDLAGEAAGLVGLGEGADGVLARFVPPPSGSLAWLQVDLPGLPG